MNAQLKGSDLTASDWSYQFGDYPSDRAKMQIKAHLAKY